MPVELHFSLRSSEVLGRTQIHLTSSLLNAVNMGEEVLKGLH